MILEGFLELIVQPVLRFFAYLVIEIVGHIFFYFTGYGLIKVATLGKRPRKSRLEHFDSTTGWHIMTIGFAFWALLVVVMLVLYVE